MTAVAVRDVVKCVMGLSVIGNRVPVTAYCGLLMIDKNHEKDLFSMIGTLKETLDSQAHILTSGRKQIQHRYLWSPAASGASKQEHIRVRFVV